MTQGHASETFDLRGAWYRTDGYYTERPVEFILLKDYYYTETTEVFYYPGRRGSYSIKQSIKLRKDTLEGTVTFFDSRGCSFRNLPVLGEVQGPNAVGFLITVPRYKFRTVTKASTGEVLRNECRILEYVEVPVRLNRY